MLRIDNIREEDRKEYLKLANMMYSSPAVHSMIPKSYFLSTLNEALKSSIYVEIYLLRYEEKCVGYCQVSKTYSQEAGGMVLLVEEIYIIEEYRGRGIAKKLFEYLFKKYETYARIRLEVDEKNEGAISVYENLEFEKLEYVQYIKDRK